MDAVGDRWGLEAHRVRYGSYWVRKDDSRRPRPNGQ